jgi:hypothetical protein
LEAIAMSYTQLKEFRIPKSSCPYVAFPFPGERPLVIRRDKLTALLRGINLTDVSIEKNEDGNKVLRLTHRTGNVRGRYTLVDQLTARNGFNVKLSIYDWAASERAKRAKPASPVSQVPKKFQTEIAKLERQIKKLYLPEAAPVNPLCWDHTMGEWERGRIETFVKQRVDRVKIARIAGQVITNGLTSTTGYKRLREAGYKVKTWSQVTERERERSKVTHEDEYWKQVYRFCVANVLTRKDVWPRWGFGGVGEALKAHGDARTRYLAQINEYKQAQYQVDAIREMAKQAMEVMA